MLKKNLVQFSCYQIFLTSIIITIIFNYANGQNSPCPGVFEYQFDGHRVYGIISIPAAPGRNSLKVMFAIEGAYDQSNAGQLSLLDSKSDAIKSIQTGGNIRYKLDFPVGSSFPDIVSIKLNKLERCPGAHVPPSTSVQSILTIYFTISLSDQGNSGNSGNSGNTGGSSGISSFPPLSQPIDQQINYPGSESLSPQIIYPDSPQITQPISSEISQPISQPISSVISQSISPTTKPPSVIFGGDNPILRPSSVHSLDQQPPQAVPSRTNDEWVTRYKFAQNCGKKENKLIAVHTIINGRVVDPGEFPWLAALFDSKRAYFCGGSLVSDKHVITAAHCTINFDWVYVELGKHNLRDLREPGVSLRISERIINHPEYKSGGGHADIAVIILSESVTFSNKISPICIWSFSGHNVGTYGTVAGWGVDRGGDMTNKPMAATVDIVSDEDCKASHEKYAEITSNSTFCAGGKNKGPCLGDSGSGFIVEISNRYYLKGIISVSLSYSSNKFSCDVTKFAVYCDVGKHLDWLKTYLFE